MSWTWLSDGRRGEDALFLDSLSEGGRGEDALFLDSLSEIQRRALRQYCEPAFSQAHVLDSYALHNYNLGTVQLTFHNEAPIHA